MKSLMSLSEIFAGALTVIFPSGGLTPVYLTAPLLPRNLFPSRVEYHKVMYQVQESFTMAQ